VGVDLALWACPHHSQLPAELNPKHVITQRTRHLELRARLRLKRCVITWPGHNGKANRQSWEHTFWPHCDTFRW